MRLIKVYSKKGKNMKLLSVDNKIGSKETRSALSEWHSQEAMKRNQHSQWPSVEGIAILTDIINIHLYCSLRICQMR